MSDKASNATIVSVEGRRLSIRMLEQPSGPDGDSWSYEATIETESARAAAIVHEWGRGLTQYWQEIASDWKGWNGDRKCGSLEGQLDIACSIDDLGQVSCTVSLGQPWPPTWRLDAEMTFGGGSQIGQFARDLELALQP